jgi:hypothetical protein
MKTKQTNTLAQGGAISFFVGAMLAVIISLSVAWPVMDSAINGGSDSASGTLTLTGNTSCGQYINVTNAANTKAPFYINITAGGCSAPPSGVAIVTIPAASNTSTVSAANITTAMNANATISGTMTATNPSAGVVRLTYNIVGTPGNSVITTETLSNGAWGSGTLTGGSYSATNNMSSAASTLVDQLPLFLVLVLLMVFIKAII